MIGSRKFFVLCYLKEVIDAIREEGRYLKELIDEKVESMVKSVKEKETKNLQILQSIENEIKTTLDKAKKQQKFYQDTQGIKDTSKLIQKLKQIKSQMDQIEEMQVPIMPSVRYLKLRLAESEIENLFGELKFGETVNKEENPTSQKNVRVTTKAKQYRYRCFVCGTEITSEEPPIRLTRGRALIRAHHQLI